MKKLLAELGRRNVFRMAVLYAVAAWMILSIADIGFGILGAPEGSLRVVFIALIIGFPVALFLSWFYEITPEGLKREVEIQPGESVTAATGRRMNFMIASGALLIVAGMAVQYFIFSDSGGLNAVDAKSIAVLPFVDMSPDGDQEYFGDGISEELLNLLAKIPDLKVAARTSAFSFKGKDVDIASIAEQLHVANVLEGSIRKAADKIRITAQLISAKDGYHLFSETYDRAMVDIFAVQDEIAAAVVEKLRVTLLDEVAPTARRTDPEVFNLYLQGRQYGRLRTAEGFEQGLAALQKAVEIDPGYAPAWEEMGHIQLTYAIYNPTDENYELAHASLEKALSIDPDLPEAWANLAGLVSVHDWNFTLADEYLQKALSLDGQNGLVLGRAGILAFTQGNLTKAIALYEEALRIDPLSLGLHVNLGLLNYHSGQFETALGYFDKAIALSPNFSQAHYHRGMVVRALGNPETALSVFENEPMEERRLMGQAFAYHDLGREAESAAAADEMTEKYLADGWGPYIAQVRAYRGEKDQAFELLDQALEIRQSNLMEVAINPHYANLHSDPRWPELMRKIKELGK